MALLAQPSATERKCCGFSEERVPFRTQQPILQKPITKSFPQNCQRCSVSTDFGRQDQGSTRKASQFRLAKSPPISFFALFWTTPVATWTRCTIRLRHISGVPIPAWLRVPLQ